jgi:hypothetical protein
MAKHGRSVTLTTHPHLVTRSCISRSYTSSPPSASMACSVTALLFALETSLNNGKVSVRFKLLYYLHVLYPESRRHYISRQDRTSIYLDLHAWHMKDEFSYWPWLPAGVSITTFTLNMEHLPRNVNESLIFTLSTKSGMRSGSDGYCGGQPQIYLQASVCGREAIYLNSSLSWNLILGALGIKSWKQICILPSPHLPVHISVLTTGEQLKELKFRVFWDVALRARARVCVIIIALMVEVVRISETSFHFNVTTSQKTPNFILAVLRKWNLTN